MGNKIVNSSSSAPNGPPEYSEFWLGKNPTPPERADLIVKRLEKFIRDGRDKQRGVAFNKWQEFAVDEVTNAIRDAEKHWRGDHRFVTLGLTIGAAALVTIGVWGSALAASMAPNRQTAALILLIAGGTLFTVIGVWSLRRLDNYFKVFRRQNNIIKISSYDKQLAKLERELEIRLQEQRQSLEGPT